MNASVTTVPGLVFILVFLWGIRRMNSPRTAVSGNLLGAAGMLGAIVLTLTGEGLVRAGIIWPALATGGVIGYVLAIRITMLKIPQMVALLNGLGGGASAIIAFVVIGGAAGSLSVSFAAALALVVGGTTFSGSLIAAAKLDGKLPPHPFLLRGHTVLNMLILSVTGLLLLAVPFADGGRAIALAGMILGGSLLFGAVFAIRIGGADMPVAISLLNSLSGMAGSVAGFAVHSPLLVAAGAIVGSAGLILTRIMCRSMNRSFTEILLGKTASIPAPMTSSGFSPIPREEAAAAVRDDPAHRDSMMKTVEVLRASEKVVIVPGYGMALSRAQHRVKQLFEVLENQGKEVVFAIHPVAGRMPGHMHVLLAEADVPYEKLFEMDAANAVFRDTDAVIIVGANDVVNPAAGTAAGTPIYGMPVLNVCEAREILIFNKDTRPGYAGVDNPLYAGKNSVLLLGDAGERIGELLELLSRK